MTNNEQLIDNIFKDLQNKHPRLSHPNKMTDSIMRKIEKESRPNRWFVPVRNCSIAAAILLLFIFTFQMITVNYATDGASIIAYQNETLSKTRPIKDGDLYINYIQKKLYDKSSYELLKKKIYESKY
ncbi:hypothetical protein [Xylanibacter oryzae]|uniref:hypothetical protein n=1 Tax=Xylanibacter oryzae TaxID=185293 RepID=UPI00055DDF9E|nr:hypothetical protein [Xylanibacter oryzae]